MKTTTKTTTTNPNAPRVNITRGTVQLADGSQDVSYLELLRIDTPIPHKLRIHIRSNSHEVQSEAHVDRFDGAQWHRLYDIDPVNMRTEHRLCYAQPNRRTPAAFLADRDELLRVAIELLL